MKHRKSRNSNLALQKFMEGIVPPRLKPPIFVKKFEGSYLRFLIF